MVVILRGTDVRFGLIERRSELLRCSAITKDDTFAEQIAELDEAIDKLWDAKEIMLLPQVTV
jgi:hypothetical protein